MTPRSLKDAREHGTYFRFNIEGWTSGLAFPAADSLEEAVQFLEEFEDSINKTLTVTSVDRYLPGGSIGCEFMENYIKPQPHATGGEECFVDPSTGCCIVCNMGCQHNCDLDQPLDHCQSCGMKWLE